MGDCPGRCSRTETCTSAAVICENLDYKFQNLSPETYMIIFGERFDVMSLHHLHQIILRNVVYNIKNRWHTCVCVFLLIFGSFLTRKNTQKILGQFSECFVYRSSNWHYRQRTMIFEFILHVIADADTLSVNSPAFFLSKGSVVFSLAKKKSAKISRNWLKLAKDRPTSAKIRLRSARINAKGRFSFHN